MMHDSNLVVDAEIVEASCLTIQYGELFEEFMNVLLGSKYSLDYLPLGGTKDGGKDARIYKNRSQNHYLQFSIEGRDKRNFEPKVRGTINALEKNKTDLQIARLDFYFAYPISPLISQKISDQLYSEKSYQVQIRGTAAIHSLVNESRELREQFWSFVETKGIRRIVESVPQSYSRMDGLDSALLYLSNYSIGEVQPDFLEYLVRTYTYLKLRETDPQAEPPQTVTVDAVIDFICAQAPFLSRENVGRRLGQILQKERLKTKEEREIRQYEKEGALALSFKARQQITKSAAAVATCESGFNQSVLQRLETGKYSEEHATIIELVKRCLGRAYADFGMDLISYLEKKETAPSSESLRSITQSITSGLDPMARRRLQSVLHSLLYDVIWRPTEEERSFCNLMARSFSLMFTTKGDSAVLNYLESSVVGLRFILGTDLIIKIFAETHLDPERQRYANMVRSLKDSRITISVTDPIVKEAAHHLKGTMEWYNENIAAIANDADSDDSAAAILDFVEKSSPKILVRAYYHARKDGRSKSFDQFVKEFVSSNPVHYKENITAFLEGMLNVKIEQVPLENSVVENIQRKLLPHVGADKPQRHREILAANDSKTIATVYKLRERYVVTQKSPLFAHNVWWLTEESKVDRIRNFLVENHGALPHIHPEVACALLANLPALRTTCKQMHSILASGVGIQMSTYVDDTAVKSLVDTYKEVSGMNDGKKLVRIREIIRSINEQAYNREGNMLGDIFGSQERVEKAISAYSLKGQQQGWAAVWNEIKANISETLDRVVVFTAAYGATAKESLEFLKQTGDAESIRGIPPSVVAYFLRKGRS